MRLSYTDVIARLCALHSEVWRAVIDRRSPADCFCGMSGCWGLEGYDPERDYRNEGLALEWIERVVREKLAEATEPRKA